MADFILSGFSMHLWGKKPCMMGVSVLPSFENVVLYGIVVVLIHASKCRREERRRSDVAVPWSQMPHCRKRSVNLTLINGLRKVIIMRLHALCLWPYLETGEH